ncbi:Pimeloyl-ACP methyl ester carboxylesterase [Cohaesibacter sp. ES.047]|uniref:alpha/beta fold hydrolase n=1 Tax=Cohaesibacter sp. ES.047 TaxID=1798205 RepID=UPI000BB78657|nr:alpha/beta hydrolase [Cohaesibacter sp. ES.047]SNY94150.1 Pimeloyl-ACP methyl ester carboxylesterase [Cohaesibacter sp. ES.047]
MADAKPWDMLMDYPVRRFEITTFDGLVLRGEVFGDRSWPSTPIFCLPGLTRNSRDFHPLAERLAGDPDNPRFVMILNSRGRGPSDYDKDPENYTVLIEANDAIHALTAAGLEKAIFIGTSRGGLLTMAIAALRPGIIASAVLNDVGPVIDATGIARIKSYLTMSKPVSDWDDALSYMKTANFNQFKNLSEEQWELFAQMTFRDEKGKPTSDFDKAIADSLGSLDLSQPLPAAWPQFIALSRCPVLVIRGENSDLLSPSTASEMLARHPDCELFEVKDQGHAPLFIFDELNERIAAFATETDDKIKQEQTSAEPAFLAAEDIIYLEIEEPEPEEEDAVEDETDETLGAPSEKTPENTPETAPEDVMEDGPADDPEVQNQAAEPPASDSETPKDDEQDRQEPLVTPI